MQALIKKHRTVLYLMSLVLLAPIGFACDQANSVVGVQDKRSVSNLDTMKVYTVKITGVSIHPIDKQKTDSGAAFYWSDTLNNQLKFEAVPEYIILDSTIVTKENMEEKLSYEVVNPVVATKDKSNFNFNKPVIFNGNRVNAGRNFLADSVLQDKVDFPTQLHPAGRAQLELDRNHFFIPPRKYMVSAKWQTEKGEILMDSTSVFINLK